MRTNFTSVLTNVRDFLGSFQDERLTVLCYHRVGSLTEDGFHGFRPNISASPERFTLQMQLVKALFTPVSMRDVLLWHKEGKPLPRRSALVTFDDGYKDNGAIAWPIMRDLGIPGIVFVVTDHVRTGKPFIWDYAAYCFERTKCKHEDIPLLGETRIATPQERHAATSAWVEASKHHPAGDRGLLMERLAASLEVLPPPEAFTGLYLNWDEIRQLERQGLEFGGHTHTHPILTKLPVAEAKEEILQCQSCLTRELDHPAPAFAYPNGSVSDFTGEHESIIQQAGFDIAFSLEPGSLTLSEVRKRPTAVRRIFIGARDHLPRTLLKLVSAPYLASSHSRRGSPSKNKEY